MLAHLSRHGRDQRADALTAGARLPRLAAVLATLTCAVLASAAAVPAASARTPVPQPYLRGLYGPGPVAPVPATTRVIIAGGMAGWQITLIAVGAALVAAVAALLMDRARAARRATPAPTA